MEYRNYTIDIEPEYYPSDPRKEFDHAGKMVCFHPRYQLGEKHDFSSPQDALDFFKREKAYFLPVYMYDHSGITISTSPFSCPWDSGQVGYIYITRKDAQKEFGPRPRRRALACLQSEIEVYDDYLTGNVYGYVVKNAAGEEIDSCWGFYGNPEKSGCIEQARAVIDENILHVLKNEGIQTELLPAAVAA
jgi:hypothetical protein